MYKYNYESGEELGKIKLYISVLEILIPKLLYNNINNILQKHLKDILDLCIQSDSPQMENCMQAVVKMELYGCGRQLLEKHMVYGKLWRMMKAIKISNQNHKE